MNTNDDYEDRQSDAWDALYNEIVKLLTRYGVEDACGHADYLVVDDDYGWARNTIEIHRLKMLKVEIILALQALLRRKDLVHGIPDWEIVILVDIPGKEGKWPPMGVTIRAREIIDGLQRQYLPPEFQNFKIPGSRPGTGND
jgi:hypothetical protein